MKITPTLEECKIIAAEGSYGVIPISTEMYADMTTPIEVLRILKKVSGHVYLLESAEADKRWGRYSFLGYDPLLEITCYNGKTTIKSELTSRTDSGDVRGIIRNVMEENKSPKLPGLPSFTGGLVGYFSYDYIKYSEPTLRLDAKDEEGFQDVNLMLFHKVIAFDNYRQKLILILNIKTDDLEINYHRAERELNNMKELLLNGEKAEHIPCKLRADFQPLFNEAAYCNMVEKAKHYIREGDIFQVVLSNRLEAEMEGSLLDAYRVLRTTNPSPYMFYFSGSDGEIVGASPETLVKLEDGVLHTFPLAGTRPRGATEEADKALEAELLADEKERSEHNMLVDLGRNDIGKISRIGTVEVEKYMSIERYSHVFIYRKIFPKQWNLHCLTDLGQIFILPLKVRRFRQYGNCIRSCCFVFPRNLHIGKFRCDQSLGGRCFFHLTDKAHPLLRQCLFKGKSRVAVQISCSGNLFCKGQCFFCCSHPF
jgi:anthranilate synthase component I